MPDQPPFPVSGIRFAPRRERPQLVEVGKWIQSASAVSLLAFELSGFLSRHDLPNGEGFFLFVMFCGVIVAGHCALILFWWLVEYCVSACGGVQIPQLLIDTQGLVTLSVFRREAHLWNEITEFRVVKVLQAESGPDYAAIAFAKDQAVPQKPRQQVEAAKVSLQIPDLGISDQSQQERLCRWFNSWRSWAMEGGVQPSLEDLDFIQRDVRVEIVPAAR